MSTNVSDECCQSFWSVNKCDIYGIYLDDYTMLMNGNNSTLFSTALSSEPHEVPSIHLSLSTSGSISHHWSRRLLLYCRFQTPWEMSESSNLEHFGWEFRTHWCIPNLVTWVPFRACWDKIPEILSQNPMFGVKITSDISRSRRR